MYIYIYILCSNHNNNSVISMTIIATMIIIKIIVIVISIHIVYGHPRGASVGENCSGGAERRSGMAQRAAGDGKCHVG